VTDPALAPPSVPAKQPRGCLATLAVLVLMLTIVGSGMVAAESVQDLPAGPVTIADGVVVVPAGGWEFAGRTEDERGVLLSNGGGSLFITVVTGSHAPNAVLDQVLAEWQAVEGTQITTGEVEPSLLRPGQAAAKVSYSGSFEGIAYPVEGEVTAVQGATTSVVFDAWAGEGDFPFIRPAVERMVTEATVP
jgi:hypothetical protein